MVLECCSAFPQPGEARILNEIEAFLEYQKVSSSRTIAWDHCCGMDSMSIVTVGQFNKDKYFYGVHALSSLRLPPSATVRVGHTS